MSKTLILCEKPSQTKDFIRGLGENFKKEYGFFESENYIVCNARGHLISLCDAEEYDEKFKSWKIETLPIIPDKFNYKITKGSLELYNIISKNMKRADVSKIVVATDAEREGELIARLIMNKVGINSKSGKELLRFWTSGALTPEEIKKTMKNLKPLSNYDRLYYAALARQQADWLVGINATRVATIKGGGGVVSIGRVQTPTLNILAQRFKEIENFKPEKYYEVESEYNKDNISFKGKLIDENNKTKSFFNKDEVQLLVSQLGNYGEILKVEKSKKSEKPPLLFSLSGVQKEANARYSIRANDTLAILQTLYDKKYTTYPRSASEVLEEGMVNLVKDTINLLGKNGYDISKCNVLENNKRVFNNEKLTDHHAIIPTGIKPNDLDKNENLIYDMICKRFIAAFYPTYDYETTEVIICINGYNFKSTGNATINKGWKEILVVNDDKNILPLLKEGDRLDTEIKILDKETKPPKHYTDGTIISAMENAHTFVKDEELKKMLKDVAGIGTPATQAGILEKLIERGYLKLENKNLIITSEGLKLIEKLENEPVSDPAYTALWEQNLNDIADGKIKGADDFMKSIVEYVKSLVYSIKGKDMTGVTKQISKTTKEVIGSCPNCKKDVFEFSKGYSCFDKECGFVLWKNKLSFIGIDNITIKIAKSLLDSYKNNSSYELKLKTKTGTSYTKKVKISKHTQYGWGVEFID